jgi:hypothetical protein
MNVFIDIETIPQQPEAETRAEIEKTIEAPGQISKPETIAEWHSGVGKYAGVKLAAIDEQYRKTALDGAKGEICSVSFSVEGEAIFTVDRREGDELNLLTVMFAYMRKQLGGRLPFFIGHNIGGFDLKFLFHRCVINRVNPEIDLYQWGRHGNHYFDTMQAWAGYGQRISQDNLCAALGIKGKPSDICGANVWDHYKAGNIARIAEYNADDVATVIEIYKRLTFASN